MVQSEDIAKFVLRKVQIRLNSEPSEGTRKLESCEEKHEKHQTLNFFERFALIGTYSPCVRFCQTRRAARAINGFVYLPKIEVLNFPIRCIVDER